MAFTNLRVKNAPFSYNGNLWNDDPTRLLGLDDYENTEGFFPIRFPNGVVIYEPTQIYKPVFWEKTGLNNQTFIQHLEAPQEFGLTAARAIYEMFNGRSLFNSDGSSNVSRSGSASKAAYIREIRSQLENAYVVPMKGYTSVSRINYDVRRHGRQSQPAFFLLGGREPTSEAPIYAVSYSGQYVDVISVKTNTNFLGTEEVSYPEPVAPEMLNYTSDATRYIPSFRGTDKEGKLSSASKHIPFFGVELEVSSMISVKELQTIVQFVEPKQEAFFVCKSDGSIDTSLATYAYEIVTAPLTPALLRKEWKILFGKLERLAKAKGLTLEEVWKPSPSNGLHVHISKSPFEGDTRELRNSGRSWASRFLAAFNSDFIPETTLIQKVSRRAMDYKQNHYCGISGSVMRGRRVSFRVGAKFLGEYNVKYAPAHGKKAATYEVRVFSGEPSLEHMLSSIDFVEAMYLFTGCHSAPRCVRFAETFKDWLQAQPRFVSLKKTLGLKA